MSEERLSPVHPGEVLLEEFLRPLGLSQNRLGLSLGVAADELGERLEREVQVRAKAS
jgi:antitoxin HigA-1